MKKRLLALVMALCLLAGVLPAGLSARAEVFTVYVVSNLLTAHKTPSTSSKSLGVMSYGEAFRCLGVSGSWARIQNSSGAIGYCLKSGLSTNNPNKYNNKIYINTAGVKVYAKPSTSARVMMKLAKNSSYTARAITTDGKWYRLQNGKYYGYVPSQYVSASPQTGLSDAFSTMVYVQDNAVIIYSLPSSSAGQKGTMYFGQSLTCTNISGNWAKVKGSVSGYCALSSLTDVNPNNLNYKITINTGNIPVYAIPSTSGRVMMKLAKNSKYTALGVTSDGKWYRLQNGKYYGYVLSQYIDDPNAVEDEPAEDGETTVYIADNTLVAYQKQSTSSKSLGTMSFGEDYTLLAVDDGWAMIRNSSGAIGYCRYGGLTTVDPNSLNDIYYVQRNSVPVYSKPLTSSSVLARYKTDDPLSIVAISSDQKWLRVQGNRYGYVLAQDVSKEKVGVTADPSVIESVTPKTVYISANTLTVYQDNSTTSKVLGVMSYGESLTITGKGDIWARVKNSSGAVGYAKLSGLTDDNPNTSSITLYVQSNGVKAYDMPSTSATSLGTMSINTKLTGLCYTPDGTWVRVKNSSGKIGYVQSVHLSSSTANPNSKLIDAVVSLAKAQLGKKYVYASEGPNTFDCSGLTYYVFKNAAGVTLKRTAYQQGYNDNYTKITSIAALRVGDLVFFNTSNDNDLCDHVGIYLGGNDFIHASSAGGKVVISSLSASSNGGYYYKNFSWGRRIL